MQVGQDVGKPQGFKRAQKYRSGWVRRSEPIGRDRDGSDQYESWEFPGSVPAVELGHWRRIMCTAEHAELIRPTKIDLCWDVIGQSYPRPEEWRARYVDLGARARTKPTFVDGKDGQTLYIGTRSADLFWRVYDKGRKLRAEGHDVPEDWVRVEVECKKGWAASLAYTRAIERCEVGDVFQSMCSWYFEGPLCSSWLPRGVPASGPGAEAVPGHLSMLKALVTQHGAILQVLQELEILGDLAELVKPSRTTKWRQNRLREEILDLGPQATVAMVAELLAAGRRVRAAVSC